jgi:hypothetical protein
MSEQKKKIPVLMTTDHTKRGVFFGYIDPDDAELETIYAERVQMAISWSSDCRGVLGLASRGPTEDCRVTAPVPAATIKGVIFVAEVTPEAEAAWAKQPWGK